jgi:DNA polymerase-3 subunit epsilon
MSNTALQGQPLEALPLTFFDVETTGLGPVHEHRICEIALLRIRGDQMESSFATLVNPHRAVDAGAFAVNKISTTMLERAPSFAAIAEQVADIIRDSVLIAHNAPFDMAFLNHEFALLGHPPLPNISIDTLVLSRQLLSCPSHSLRALASDLGLAIPTHRAMSDVIVLRSLFERLAPMLAPLGITNLGEILRYQRGLLPGEPEPDPPPLVAQALRENRLLRIIYRSRSTPHPTERVVQPLEISQMRGGIYVRAYCHLRKDVRLFALNKIEEMELL